MLAGTLKEIEVDMQKQLITERKNLLWRSVGNETTSKKQIGKRRNKN